MIEESRKFQEIVQTIKRDIVLGKIKPKEKIPSERRMSELYGVGRGTIREALKTLEAVGLLSVLSGRSGGYFVNENAPKRSKEALTSAIEFDGPVIIDSFIFRKMFEPKTCFYAAIKRTKNNLSVMERSIKEMERGPDSSDTYAETNLTFHLEIGKASGNSFIAMIYPYIRQMMIEIARTIHRWPTAVEVSVYFHKAILDSIRRQEAEEAEILMNAHLSYFQDDLKQAKELGI